MRVAGLGLRGVAEQAADVGIALDVGLPREVQVAAVRLRLAREGILEVVVGLAALEARHRYLLCDRNWMRGTTVTGSEQRVNRDSPTRAGPRRHPRRAARGARRFADAELREHRLGVGAELRAPANRTRAGVRESLAAGPVIGTRAPPRSNSWSMSRARTCGSRGRLGIAAHGRGGHARRDAARRAPRRSVRSRAQSASSASTSARRAIRASAVA